MVAKISFLAVILLSCTAVRADHHESLAYIKSYVGAWDTIDSTGGTGTLTITEGGSGQCFIIEGNIGDHRFDGLLGFHPETNQWTIISVSEDGSRYTHQLSGVPTDRTAKAGHTWTARSRGMSKDGTPISKTLAWDVSGPNKFEVLIMDRKIGDDSRPNRKLTCVRRKPNIDVVHSAVSEIWSNGNVDRIKDVFAEDYVGHFPVGTVHGHDGIKARVKAHRTAFPDWTEEIDETIVDGDRIVIRFTSRGTNLGPFLGRPPTNNRVEISEVCLNKLTDGKIVEQWIFPDMRSMQMQLRAQ